MRLRTVRTPISAAAIGLVLMACGEGATPSGEREPAPIAGGWVPVGAMTEEIQTAETLAVDAVIDAHMAATGGARESLTVGEIAREQQVVAGMNYRFTVALTAGPAAPASYAAVVYVDLEGVMAVTRVAPTGEPGP